MSGILAGRSALITGASRGLGLEIARSYVSEGANVFLCARTEPALHVAVAEVTELATEGQGIAAMPADVADPEAVSQLVTAAVARFPDLSILVSNAGVYGPKGAIEALDWQQWVRTIEINLMGSVLAAREIIPQLRAVGRGKIIQLSGGGATQPLPGLSAYAASKAAIVRFVETLALELADERIDVNAVAPGAMNTRMLDEVLEAGPERVGQDFYDRAVAQHASGGTPLATGAEMAVWLASGASDGISGKLLSALWDPYREFDAHREELATDVYTLRRIVPGDRGMDWGD